MENLKNLKSSPCSVAAIFSFTKKKILPMLCLEGATLVLFFDLYSVKGRWCVAGGFISTQYLCPYQWLFVFVK